MKRKIIPYIYIAFFVWNSLSVYGQDLILEIAAKDTLNSVLLSSIEYQKKHESKVTLFKSLDSIKKKVEKIGFLNYSMDSIVKQDSIFNYQFDLGNQNKTIRVFYSNKDISQEQLFTITSNVNDHYFDVAIENLSAILNDIVGIFESQGSSFAEVSLKSILVTKDLIEGHLHIEKSEVRKIDKVVLNGYTDFPKTYLEHYLKLNGEKNFNKNILTKTSTLLNSLPFVSEIKPPDILFTNDSTIVYLYLKKMPSNKFDGLIGFTSKENGNGLLFNGYLDLSLNNIFNSGESFSLYWKGNGNERQVFNLNISTPYIFNSKFSPKAELNIYKQDSSFINTKTKFSLSYSINERNSIGLSLQGENSSNLLSINPNDDINGFKNLFYGVNYYYRIENENNLFPIKFDVFSEILTGSRKIKGVDTKQTKFNFRTSYLWNLNFKNHIFFQNESRILLSSNTLTNELFKIGGVNSIRGFNEESIFTSTYSYFNIEYRYSTNISSYLYSITDLGYVSNKLINLSSQIYSLGFGYAFQTKFGFLNLSYALGSFSEQVINFDNSRFHVKILSFF